MKPWHIVAALTLSAALATPGAAFELQLANGVTSSINVTSDSTPGWIPTPDQRQRALKAVEVFLNALLDGRYGVAYAMLADFNQRNLPAAQFSQDAQKFHDLAGALKFWRVLTVTWTKDPAQAPMPGIYVAIDLAAQFANIDRDCGYIVLYQPAAGGDFIVIRREDNYLDNATARNIEAKQSKAALANIWGQMSRYCPNFQP